MRTPYKQLVGIVGLVFGWLVLAALTTDTLFLGTTAMPPEPVTPELAITPTVTPATSTPSLAAGPVPATVEPTIDSVPALLPVYQFTVTATGTVLEAMKTHQTTKPAFTFAGREFTGLGLLVESINGQSSANGFYWTLYINNTLADRGVSTAMVYPDDLITWRYQNGL